MTALGVAEFKQGHFEPAIAVLDLEGGLRLAYLDLGAVYAAEGRSAEAIAAFRAPPTLLRSPGGALVGYVSQLYSWG